MERLARLLPFRTYGRTRHLRSVAPCGPRALSTPLCAATVDEPAVGNVMSALLPSPVLPALIPALLPSLLPAFSRLPLRGSRQPQPAMPVAADPVRVYRSPSRMILVGNINAVCNMLDQCIADERAGLRNGLFK